LPPHLWIGNLKISFSFWFFVVVAAFLQLGMDVMVPYVVLPILVHEGGHLLAMRLYGVKVREIAFTPFSVNIRRGPGEISDTGEIVISLAGVCANLLAALGLYLLRFQSMRVILMIGSHLAVALFNLLPVGDLDGGEVCGCVCRRYFSPRMAYGISKTVSFLALTPLFALAILLLLRGLGNISLFLACVYLAATVIFRE